MEAGIFHSFHGRFHSFHESFHESFHCFHESFSTASVEAPTDFPMEGSGESFHGSGGSSHGIFRLQQYFQEKKQCEVKFPYAERVEAGRLWVVVVLTLVLQNNSGESPTYSMYLHEVIMHLVACAIEVSHVQLLRRKDEFRQVSKIFSTSQLEL